MSCCEWGVYFALGEGRSPYNAHVCAIIMVEAMYGRMTSPICVTILPEKRRRHGSLHILRLQATRQERISGAQRVVSHRRFIMLLSLTIQSDSGRRSQTCVSSAINVGNLWERITGLEVYGDYGNLHVLKEGSVWQIIDKKPYRIDIREMGNTMDYRNGAGIQSTASTCTSHGTTR